MEFIGGFAAARIDTEAYDEKPINITVTAIAMVFTAVVSIVGGAFLSGVFYGNRQDGNNGNGHLTWLDALLNKESVDNLVKGAVATNDDDMAIARVNGRHSELRGVALMLSEDRLAANAIVAQ